MVGAGNQFTRYSYCRNMWDITQCHALQVYVVENLVAVCVRACVRGVVSVAGLPVRSRSLIVPLYSTHEAETGGRN